MATLDPNSSYTYSPLNSDKAEIRVLIVRPGEGDYPIHTDLQHVSLHDPGEYEAISYCWGDARKRASITVGGMPLDVPASAEAAIRRVRTNVDRTIWIDAVCINQSDLKEREQQVSLMGDIYQKMVQNIVWLGESQHDTAEAMQITDAMWVDLLQEADSPENLPSFERLWCLQEVVLAPRSVVICGEFECSLLKSLESVCGLGELSNNMKFPDYLNQCYHTSVAYATNSGRIIMKLNTLFSNLIDWDVEYGYRWLYDKSVDTRNLIGSGSGLNQGERSMQDDYFQRILIRSREFQTNIPHDKAFGILGLLKKNLWVKDASFWKLLEVDYTKSFAHVMRDVTRAFVLDSNNLDQFFIIFKDDNPDAYKAREPSWALRLGQASDFANGVASLPNAEAFPACKIDKPPSFHSENPNIMILNGIVVDLVPTVSPALSGDLVHTFLRDKRARASHLRILFNMISPLQNDPEHTQMLLQSISRTLIVTGSTQYTKETSSTMFMQWTYRVLFSSESCDSDDTFETYVYLIFQTHLERRFFCTDNGYMGLGPQHMSVNDIVVVIQGSNRPLVLRPTKDISSNDVSGEDDISSKKSQYKGGPKECPLVGDCWVDGIMQGQAVTKHMSRGLEQEVFDIR